MNVSSALQTNMASSQINLVLTRQIMDDAMQQANDLLEMLPDVKTVNPSHLGQNLDIYA
ncbi:MAG: YjfB family protein [Oscillospiraceae bacterium]|nr:YjfB family protein [Oscillospiraceae bacterium]